MTALTEFLLARIAEDEARRMAYWHDSDCAMCHSALNECDCGSQARVLAECEAKRAIVMHMLNAERTVARAERLRNRLGGEDTLVMADAQSAEDVLRETACILGHMAEVYEDHPDFDAEWIVWRNRALKTETTPL